MPKKNNLNRNTSIIVKFYDCSDKEVDQTLKSINLSGVRVSNLINRWAIEVPFWKEQHYIDKLESLDLIEKIHTSLSFATKNYYNREQQDNQDDN